MTGSLLQASDQNITVLVDFDASETLCLCLFVYAKCSKIDRQPLWNSFTQISTSKSLPWILAGDFNIISHSREKAGGGALDLNAIALANFMILFNRVALSGSGW